MVLQKAHSESLRTQYEMKRYDHCIVFNRIIQRHRYDLILNLCAAFCGFETFFHIGYEAACSHKAFHESIRSGLSEKERKQKAFFDKIVAKNREILVAVLKEGNGFFDYKQRVKLQSARMTAAAMRPQPLSVPHSPDGDGDDLYGDGDDEFISKRDRMRFKHVSLDCYDGYLWKQSSSKRKKWQKRWFVLTNGELEYVRVTSGGVPSEKVKRAKSMPFARYFAAGTSGLEEMEWFGAQ